jgi:hypothetical protein
MNFKKFKKLREHKEHKRNQLFSRKLLIQKENKSILQKGQEQGLYTHKYTQIIKNLYFLPYALSNFMVIVLLFLLFLFMCKYMIIYRLKSNVEKIHRKHSHFGGLR